VAEKHNSTINDAVFTVVTVAGICNLVGGGVVMTCHRSGGAGGGGE